jgi:hypothetical protein
VQIRYARSVSPTARPAYHIRSDPPMCRLAAGSGARPEVRRQLEPLLELAERGQHVLTCRGILKYVPTEAATRAQEIQHLLNLTSAETTRRTFVTVRHRCREAAGQA